MTKNLLNIIIDAQARCESQMEVSARRLTCARVRLVI
jgi:hypothetical protein